MAMCLLQHYWKSFLKEPSDWENFVINSPICGRNNTNSAQTLTENWRIISKLIYMARVIMMKGKLDQIPSWT